MSPSAFFQLRLLRHATHELEFAGRKLLVDPMLAEPGSYKSLTLFRNPARNPRVPLPLPTEAIALPDAVLVTHGHFDHFDETAARLLPKAIPLFCQPSDQAKFRKLGFTQVRPVGDEGLTWGGITIIRTGGRHGEGIEGRLMGSSSGFVLAASGSPTVYLAGDTIWCPEVESVLREWQPEVAVLNAGEARFELGGPITMGADDVVRVCRTAPRTRVVAIHMEAVNHCLLTRKALAERLEREGLRDQVALPMDGETVRFDDRP